MTDFRYKGLAALILATFFHASTGIFSRYIGRYFGVFFQSWVRAAIMFCLLGLFLLRQKNWTSVKKADLGFLLGMGFLDAFIFIFTFTAFNHLPIGTVLFLFYASATIGGYVLGRLLFKERVTILKAVSLFLCLTGLFIIFSFSADPGRVIYLALAFFGGCLTACWNVFSKKISSRYPATQIFLIDTSLVFGISLALSLYFKDIFAVSVSGWQPWAAIFWFAVVNIAAALLTIYGFKHMPVQVAAITMLLEIIYGIIFGWLIFGEALTEASVVGGLFILFGVALPNLNFGARKIMAYAPAENEKNTDRS